MVDGLLRIGEVAERLGVSTHLLRHWEAEGVITPYRSTSGARRYSPQQVDEIAAGLRCRSAGLGLADLALLLRGSRGERRAVVERQVRALRTRQVELGQAADFLDHVLECRHPVMQECAQCRDFAGRSGYGEPI